MKEDRFTIPQLFLIIALCVLIMFILLIVLNYFIEVPRLLQKILDKI